MSNLDKLNKILFTIMSILIIVTAILVIAMIIPEITNNHSIDTPPMLSNERMQELKEQNLYQEKIDFDYISSLDTTGQFYLLPVKQVLLDKPSMLPDYDELIDQEIILDEGITKGIISYGYQNTHNNLVILDIKKNTQDIIFKTRICIVEYRSFSWKNSPYLLISACTHDDNKDGQMDNKDLKYLYLYDVKNKELTTIIDSPFLGSEFRYSGIKDDNIFITISNDIDGNYKYDASTDQKQIYKFNIQTRKLESIVGTKLLNDLQSILNGSTL